MICSSEIPIFISSQLTEHPPDPSKHGFLKKTGGSFNFSKKRRYFEIDNLVLKYFTDKTKKTPLGEIELDGAYAELGDPKQHGPMSFVIRLIDGGNIGWKVRKGKKERSNHTEYVAYGDSIDDILAWIESINLCSFCTLLTKR